MLDPFNTNVTSEYEEELNAALSNHETYVKVALENIVDLCNIAKTIKDSKGINRNLAVTIESIYETTLDTERYPINSFTVDTTLTNYDVTMESISQTIGKILKGIWDSTRKFFGFIYNLIARLFAKVKSKEKEAHAIEEELVNVQKETLLLLEHLPPDAKKEFISGPDDALYNDGMKKISNDLLVELCHHTPLAQAIVEVSMFFKEYIKQCEERINFITVCTTRIQNISPEHALILANDIKSNMESVYLKEDHFLSLMEHIDDKGERLLIPKNNNYSSNVLAAEIITLCKVSNKLIESKNEGIPTYTAYKHSMLSNFKLEKMPIIGVESEIEEFTQKMMKAYRTQIDISDIEFGTIGPLYHHLCVISRREILACENYFSLAYRLINLRVECLSLELQNHNVRMGLLKKMAKGKAKKDSD